MHAEKPDRATPDAKSIADALLAWYARERRELPWRCTTDPYRIWVSEIMLQQTQVVTVIPYYERFLARFPTVCALAKASLDDLLALWQGLGYYARARNLHTAAKIICEQHGGNIPSRHSDVLSLPGVGAYTAGAILSIAFGQDIPAIDGNAVRVLCHLFDYDRDPTKARGKKAMRCYSQELLPPGRGGDYNQAMMELGARICLPRAPLCDECPLAPYCKSRALGNQAVRPVPKVRKQVPHRRLVAALFGQDGCLLIVRRVPSGLLGGLWELPGGEVSSEETDAHALGRHLCDGLDMHPAIGPKESVVKHAYTHFRITVHTYRCAIDGMPVPTRQWDDHHWLSPDEMPRYGLTGVTRKILSLTSWLETSLLPAR
jgi:A/G-specific adenine glycosylase